MDLRGLICDTSLAMVYYDILCALTAFISAHFFEGYRRGKSMKKTRPLTTSSPLRTRARDRELRLTWTVDARVPQLLIRMLNSVT